MRKSEFKYKSKDGKTQIYGVEWLPDENPKAILQIAHGVTEYISRYEEFAQFLTQNGIAVVGNDHLGHGNSIAVESEPMYFGPEGSWEWVVEDIKTCTDLTKKKYSNIPYYLLGFSLGSFAVRTFLIKYPEKLDGVIIVGTGQTSNFQISLAKFIANKEGKKVGEDKTSPIINKLTFETYNKKFAPNRTEYDWLCANEKAIDEYIQDSMRGKAMSPGLFREMLRGMSFSAKQKNINRIDKNLSILFLSGDKDPVGEQGKGVIRAYKSFLKAGIKNVDIKLYHNLRHDILREENRLEIFNDIYQFMKI